MKLVRGGERQAELALRHVRRVIQASASDADLETVVQASMSVRAVPGTSDVSPMKGCVRKQTKYSVMLGLEMQRISSRAVDIVLRRLL